MIDIIFLFANDFLLYFFLQLFDDPFIGLFQEFLIFQREEVIQSSDRPLHIPPERDFLVQER